MNIEDLARQAGLIRGMGVNGFYDANGGDGFEALERFATIVRNQVLEDAIKTLAVSDAHTNEQVAIVMRSLKS